MISDRLTRRGVLAGLMASAGTAALAEAPLTAPRPRLRGSDASAVEAPSLVRNDPSEAYIAEAKLGGAVGYALIDLETGEVLAERSGDQPLPPASTLKAVTALYALDCLGPSHRFRTELIATGPLVGSKIQGDLVLVGDGDPTLDTDRLLDLARALSELGITGITGRFLAWGGALPEVSEIAEGQPIVAGYNPAVGGLNLNFNRVHFNWKRNGSGYDTTLLARGINASPETSVAEVRLVDRAQPIFDHQAGHSRDRWTVAEGALDKEGARWLPVRHPALYAGDVFRALADAEGVALPPVGMAEARPLGTAISGVAGPELATVLRGMLKFSTNLTAEVTGMSSSVVNGGALESLPASATRMAEWAARRSRLEQVPVFADHSGLGYGSEMTPMAMTKILARGAGTALPGLLKVVNLGIDDKRPAPGGVKVVAKTGTLNFVSTLAGYMETGTGGRYAFAIFTGDVARRDGVPLDRRDRPDGGRSYLRRSRVLQKRLLRYWGTDRA